MTRGGRATRVVLALLASVGLTTALGAMPVMAGKSTKPPTSSGSSCTSSLSSSSFNGQCNIYISGSNNRSPNPPPSPPAKCVSASWTTYEPATIDYKLPAGQGDWLTGLQLTTTNPATGGSYTIPDESQVIPVSSAYFVDASWTVTETPGGTAKNPTCTFSAKFTGGVGFYPVPVPCAQAGDCASVPWSNFRSLENQIAASWKPATPTSSPPAGSITVWVPTIFTAQLFVNGQPWAPTKGSNDMIMSSSAQARGLEAGRTLNIVIQLTTLPVAVEWQYTAKGAQSSKTGFSCTFYSSYPKSTSAVGAQECNPADDPNAGMFSESGSGYVFTHDATSLAIRSRVLVQVQATATFFTTQKWTETLANAKVWSPWSSSEQSTIQQVEGVTQP